MPRIIAAELVEPVARTLLGVIDVEDGPTSEQLGVLQALVAAYWGHPDLAVADAEPLSADEAAKAVTEPSARRRLRELMVLLELCRHPISDAQVARVGEYAAALGESGPGMEVVRDLVHEGAEVAGADYHRFMAPRAAELAEPALRRQHAPGDLAEPDHALGAQLRALHDLPVGTLGHEYVEFYRRNGLTLPGDDPHNPVMFVWHDMCHVIGGYEPVGVDEIALGAMQLAVADTDTHWLQLLGNLAVHEAGFLGGPNLVPKRATLARPGATETLAHAMLRGSQCTGDFTTADHLAMAERSLDDVRREFGVPPREC